MASPSQLLLSSSAPLPASSFLPPRDPSTPLLAIPSNLKDLNAPNPNSSATSVASSDQSDNDNDNDSMNEEITTSLLISPDIRNKVDNIMSGNCHLSPPPPHPSPTPTNILCPPGNTTYPQLHLRIQQYISSFQYNHTGKNYFQLRRDRGMQHVSGISREMIREGLPIQCVEATFLGIYLTMVALKHLDTLTVLTPNSNKPAPPFTISGAGKGCRKYCGVMRLPISFKTECDGSTYRHIVLGVYAHTGNNSTVKAVKDGKAAKDGQAKEECATWAWGGLGISRRKTLMYKELDYPTLSSLVKEYIDSYEGSWHKVLKIYIGLPFSYEETDTSRTQWRCLRVEMDDTWVSCAAQIDKYSKDCVQIYDYFSYTGALPDLWKQRYSPRTPRDKSAKGDDEEEA